MRMTWRRYLLVHIGALLTVAAFALYAWIARLLPADRLHCVLHDILHLYCPFCGGTRAFRALLSLELREAMRLCGDMIVAMLLLLILDIRAFILLCRKRQEPFGAPALLQIAVLYLFVAFLVRNTALLLGYDAIGDLLPYWQARVSPLLALGFFYLSLVMIALFLIALNLLPVAAMPRAVAGWGAGYALVLLTALLYSPWFLLALLPITVILLSLCLLLRRKKDAL